ncbi:zinc finger, CCHC-type containing protein [Tanacetum coccineum]
MCLFQFSLPDQARNWLERLPAGSITTWEDLTTCFLAQFFPPGRTAKFHNDILMFQQHQKESLSKAWTRLKDLLQNVPHHGIDLWLLIYIFYDRVDYTTQMGIDYAAGERLRKLRPDEAWATIEKLSPYRKKFECSEYSRVVCTKCATMLLLGFTFTLGTSSTRISSPAKVLLKPSSSPLTKTLSPAPNRYDYNHLGVRFRLRGEKKEISFLELGWRIVAAIRDPRVKLAYRCITMSITGRKESTHSVTEIDLFYLYCIYSNEVVCNIPYWLAKYMVGIREKSLICEGMFVTWIAQSYGLLNKEMMGALSVEPSPHVFKKKSLISMRVIMELHNGGCFWPAALETVEEDEEDDKGDEAAGGDAGHEGAGGSVDMYRNMSQGDCQVCQARWMDQQDEEWGRINTWMGQQDERAHWMYDHIVCQF